MVSKITYVGIDPGIHGAVAIYNPDGALVVQDTPSEEVKKGRKKVNVYLPDNMAEILRELKPATTKVFLEAVHAMPKNGSMGSFGLGKGFGIWLGIIAAFKLPVTLVSPQRWKKTYDLLGKDKDAARGVALQHYPAMMPMLKRKKDVDRADAILIMEYGRKL